MNLEDHDECISGNIACDVNAYCTNTVGSYYCTCKQGYTGDRRSCSDIDECLNGTHGCDVNAECNNTLGSYKCTCKDGFQGNGSKCTDTNECTEGKHDCDVNAECNNTLGSYKCTCKDGYEGNGTNCTEKLWSVIICEGGKRTISCDNDQRTIDVVDANYGRLDSNTCHHSAVSDTNCKAANSLFIVRLKCNEEGSCELHADSLVFGDPCPGTYKYLEVKYKCVNLGHKSVGCYKLDGISRLTHELTGSDPIFNGIYPAQPGSFISKCAVAVIRAGYRLFAVESNDTCSANASTPHKIEKLKQSKKCGLGDANAFQVYNIRDLRCLGTLGMESGAITNGQISFSSQKRINTAIVRLHHTGRTWIADENDIYQWLRLDLRAQNTEVTRVATQGSHQHNKWVKKYKLQYSNYGVRFQKYKEQGQTISKVFVGNTDQNTVVYHDLNPPITARYIRFKPVEWQGWISMRVELYGCVQGFTAVFTNLGKIGSNGPRSIGSHYKDQDHDGQVTVSSGIQDWTVPRTGEYRIEAIGASGGYSEGSFIKTGGRGARMIGNFNLTKDEIIHVLVGQKGEKGNSNPKTAGGGGGTFVVRENNKFLIIAGGGGGMKNVLEQHPGCDASINTKGNGGNNLPLGSGGSNGNGGKASTKYSGGGGGGFYSDGKSASRFTGLGGKGYLQEGEGGSARGGFGGGGGLRGGGYGLQGGNGGAGGGGGYSGGNGGANEQFCGGGGGSFNSGTNQQNECCFNRYGHGRVIITFLQ